MPNGSVRKYVLQLVPKQIIKLEDDAVILGGVGGRWTEPVLYVFGQHKQLNTKHTIRMYVTGEKFNYNSETMTYLGKYPAGDDTYHFFDVAEPA